MSLRARLLLLVALLFALLGVGSAGTCGLEPTVYGLTVDSGFEEGCFPPLRCALNRHGPVGGTLRLTRIPTIVPEEQRFAVSEIFWLVRVDGEDVRITGSGSLTRLQQFAVRQELHLLLKIGDAEVEEFQGHSIVRPGDPNIDVRVSRNGERGFDTVIDVRAVPFPRLEDDPGDRPG